MITKVELSCGIALIRGFPIPLHRFRVILAHSLALVITTAKVELRLGMSLIRGFPIPLYRLRVIFVYSLAIVIAISKINHTRHTAQFFRPFAEMFHRFLIIPRLRVIKVMLTGTKIMPHYHCSSLAFRKRHFFYPVQFSFTAFVG